MKTKERISKEQATLEKKRRRRTNLELLKLPTGSMRTMKEIAGAADLPVGRVFQDIVEAGLAVIRNPDSSPYESMIQFRKTLHEHEKQSKDTDRGGDGPGRSSDQHVGNGEMAENVDETDSGITGTVSGLARVERTEERSSDPDEQSRRESEIEESDDVVTGLGVSDSPSDDDQFDDRTVPEGQFDSLTGERR